MVDEVEQSVAAEVPTAEKQLDLASLVVEIEPLREEREGKSRKDLSPQIIPSFETQDGSPIESLHKSHDYYMSFFRVNDEEEVEPVDEVAEVGTYEARIVGVSTRLSGEVTVRFEVKPRHRKGLVPLVFLLCAVILGVGGYFLLNPRDAPWYDPNAGQGLAGIHGEDLQALLEAQITEGMMNITILDYIYFPEGTLQPGEVGFNNIQNNHFDQKLTLTLDETDEVLYESGAIMPGQNIQYITLNRELPLGVHEATAAITGYDPETHVEQGVMEAKVSIVVQDGTQN